MSNAATRTFVFETTHHAMWAEDVAREEDIPAEVIPAPPDLKAKCGLALRIVVGRTSELESALQKEGIIYQLIA